MSYHQPDNWANIATIEDNSAKHQLSLQKDDNTDAILVSCVCQPVNFRGVRKPLGKLSFPNGRAVEIYNEHLSKSIT